MVVVLAQKADDPAMNIETHHLFWSNSFFMGDYAGARHHAEPGIGLYDRQRDHRLTYVYSGHDPGVCCRCFSGLALWHQGEADRALARSREALTLAANLSLRAQGIVDARADSIDAAIGRFCTTSPIESTW
ncbi:hypothetical protein [Dongia deserti]|uniref:hypothetical protein n=1 Tax=Dongia deserti TaxID=2268030 RepID=UPI0013C52B33|nr:hypothetical protein [Dongia deserti]